MYKKIAIVGLPGSGKTTLGVALLMEKKSGQMERNREVAFVSGDQLLPQNMIAVMSVLDCYIAEHFCLSMNLLNSKLNIASFVELIIYLDVPVDVCFQRVLSRNDHKVNFGMPIEDLHKQIVESVTTLEKMGVPVIRVTLKEQERIATDGYLGAELMEYIKSTV